MAYESSMPLDKGVLLRLRMPESTDCIPLNPRRGQRLCVDQWPLSRGLSHAVTRACIEWKLRKVKVSFAIDEVVNCYELS